MAGRQAGAVAAHVQIKSLCVRVKIKNKKIKNRLDNKRSPFCAVLMRWTPSQMSRFGILSLC